MDTVHQEHFVSLDSVVFVLCSNHHKYYELKQMHFCLEYLCIQDLHVYMVVDELVVVLLRLIQRMHNI